ncbi:Mog1p/PsbP-like protein [Sporormia fimetaria CBS 119925]|uniref:Mog1p/PsbP-like protein n=1 Tax=Sporormia fimetaria CBS 119925 TaxID=1340428 RepID=A0A6A6UZK5_9PLEO|nr:Mog1p/PsbP-like protein [Sporormia fimetaria CBS 119925]
MPLEYKSTELYGGAIVVDLPTGFGDVSTIRQIPDHQEVYVDSNGYSNVVFEILEHVDKPSDADALQYHFQDLVDGTNDSTNVLSQETAKLGKMDNQPAQILSFLQTPQNPNPRRKEPEFVSIHLLLVRLPGHGTDILVTVNVPHYPGEYEKAAQNEPTELMKDGAAIAKQILDSFEVKNWGLFSA